MLKVSFNKEFDKLVKKYVQWLPNDQNDIISILNYKKKFSTNSQCF